MKNNGLIFLNMLDLPPKTLRHVLNAGIDFSQAESFCANEWQRLGLAENEIKRVEEIKKSGGLPEELRLIEKNNVTVITALDADYPALLKEINYAPPVLYVWGNVSVLNEFSLAIIGSRSCTQYGINMACEFARKLSNLGVVVVSGLARGIDTAAHTGALNNKTVAVLGSGLLNVYPRENKSLVDLITRHGAVISEFPLNTLPLRENFPRRNRIVSGLAKGVVVVEASLKSGALITANFALEQNREVFALPGKPHDIYSEGTNSLIQCGAKLVQNVDDIIAEFNLCVRPN